MLAGEQRVEGRSPAQGGIGGAQPSPAFVLADLGLEQPAQLRELAKRPSGCRTRSHTRVRGGAPATDRPRGRAQDGRDLGLRDAEYAPDGVELPVRCGLVRGD